MNNLLRATPSGKRSLLLAAALLLTSLPIRAQGASDLAINLVAQQVVSKDGKEALEAGDRAKPGDIIQYTATYKNKGASTLRNLQPKLPIPVGMELLLGSAVPKVFEASRDGRKFEAPPLKWKVKNSTGVLEEQDAPPAAYRALRWNAGDLAPGASTKVVARVKITNAAGVEALAPK